MERKFLISNLFVNDSPQEFSIVNVLIAKKGFAIFSLESVTSIMEDNL